MLLDEIHSVLEGDIKAAQFLSDNFKKVEFIGSGTISKVFKAHSTRFHP